MQSTEQESNDSQFAAEASILCCGYNIGYFTKKDIERWADEYIAAFDVPSDALLDLSMIREMHPLDVMKLLKSLGETVPDQSIDVQVGFIGLCYNEGKISLENAVRGLYALTRDDRVSHEDLSTIYWLDDAYDLAAAGYHASVDEVDRDLRQFVLPFVAKLQEFHKSLFHRRTA